MQSKILTAFCLSLFALSSAMAGDIQFNGFASVVMGYDIEDENEDTTSPESPYSERTVDSLQESKVALQWTATVDKGMRFVREAMARGDSAEGYVLNYDWAYFDFNIGDSGKLKVGRLRIPFYKYSDYLDVGYAYHWITPPEDMYSLSFSNMDGVGYQHNFQSGPLEHSLNMVIGSYQGVLTLAGVPANSSLENLIAINWAGAIGDHEFYAAYAQADTYVPAAASEGLAPLAAPDNGDVLIDGDLGHFVGIGYKGMFGDAAIYAEYSIVGVDDSVFADTQGGYLGGSYNMGDYTYHLTYGFRSADEKTYSGANADTDIGFATVAAAGGVPTAADASGSTLNSTARLLGNGDSNTIIIGARKDIGMATALKLELTLYTEDRVQTDQVAAVEEEKTSTTLKFAIETMF